MDRKELKRIKALPKRLGLFQFKPLKKGSLPDPWRKYGGPRLAHTGVIDIGHDLCVLFMTRDGETSDRRAFFGFMYRRTDAGMEPVFIMHYHPSHKGVHMQANCDSDYDYLDRQLPGAVEFALKTREISTPSTTNCNWSAFFANAAGLRFSPPTRASSNEAQHLQRFRGGAH